MVGLAHCGEEEEGMFASLGWQRPDVRKKRRREWGAAWARERERELSL